MSPLAPNDFSHLHVDSEFSLLDGLSRRRSPPVKIGLAQSEAWMTTFPLSRR
jgi:hypothetical protein